MLNNNNLNNAGNPAANAAAANDPWGMAGNNNNNNNNNNMVAIQQQQQREQRQRSIRFLMMFLLMLTLMDGEEAQRKQQQQQQHQKLLEGNLRKSSSSRTKLKGSNVLPQSIYQSRQDQEDQLKSLLGTHRRYQRLIQKNHGTDHDWNVRQWVTRKQRQQQNLDREISSPSPPPPPPSSSSSSSTTTTTTTTYTAEEQEKQTVWHYPWNVTGFYRGEWSRNSSSSDSSVGNEKSSNSNTPNATVAVATAHPPLTRSRTNSTPMELETPMLQKLQDRGDSVSVLLVPDPAQQFSISNGSLPEEEPPDAMTRNHAKSVSHQPSFLRGATLVTNENKEQDADEESPELTLTQSSGRVAFQLYSRTVPAMKELSIVDGFVKLYDSNTVGYSTRRDVLLRVHGVILHSLGIVSLASSPSPARSALVVLSDGSKKQPKEQKRHRRRRLQEALQNPIMNDQNANFMEQIREDALALYPPSLDGPVESDFDSYVVSLENNAEAMDIPFPAGRRRRLVEEHLATPNATMNNDNNATTTVPTSKFVFPFPFVMDDPSQSIGRTKTPAARSMPPREQLLEANAGSCEFEIDLNVQEEEWTISKWQTLLARHVKEASQLDPMAYHQMQQQQEQQQQQQQQQQQDTNEESEEKNGAAKMSKTTKKKSSRRNTPQDQALVMTLNGTIVSTNCDFRANINATAVRTDWEHTTGKAINYSFYMMLTCLTQIVLLLRQLLHSQSQSAAIRVSLLCIGWQTVLDALLCLVHIYFSLAMQPLFTAFASVAFFKLLIFCVIEMKYMAIIIQARNSSNGGNTVDVLRRQIAMLHLRFYVALLGAFIAFFYAWEFYRTVYMLVLYSFWVPQIIYNIITEAKRPLHQYYIYGMSLTRLVAPIYIFAVRNNFLKEVYPDSPTSVFMCELLVLWVGIQAAVLEMQGRYGARFMIPARFLPPKFDYNRPIPPSLLPPEIEDETPSASLHKDRAPPEMSTIPSRESSTPRRGARNRMKGSRMNKGEAPMTTETIRSSSARPLPSFDCVICYNAIDIRNRSGYMLAPCDHLFHKDCLVQWMEVKMECPICRTDLPPL